MEKNITVFSIIVPTYNRQKKLFELLDSLEKQTYKNFEVIVIDDCSDNIVFLSKSYNFSCRIIRNDVNLGVAMSRNKGVEMAKSKWVMFLDDDDRFDESKCQTIKQHIDKNPYINFIYHPAICCMTNEGYSYKTNPQSDLSKINLLNMLKSNQIGGIPMICIKRNFFNNIGGFDNNLRALEDYDLLLRVVGSDSWSGSFLMQALTICYFESKKISVSKHIKNTEQALNKIKLKYVDDKNKEYNFHIGSLKILANAHLMMYSRLKASSFYFELSIFSKSLNYLLLAIICFVNPNFVFLIKKYYFKVLDNKKTLIFKLKNMSI